MPGQFVKEGMVITTRGCVRKCQFCLVPKREGKIRYLPIKSGWDVQDNNLLACNDIHIIQVFNMLAMQSRPAVFSGGLDLRRLLPWHVNLLKTIRLDHFYVACDSERQLRTLKAASRLLSDFHRDQKRCYVLIGFRGDTIQKAEKRLRAVYEMGFLPFAMTYRSENANQRTDLKWARFARTWSRPAAYKAKMKRVRG